MLRSDACWLAQLRCHTAVESQPSKLLLWSNVSRYRTDNRRFMSTGVLQSDACRLAQLRCHTAVAGHPFRLFSWGNRRSLWDEPTAAGIPIRDRIVDYYR